ncbi:MAG: ortholog of Bordetella pertussis (BX470248) BP2750 [uncultured Paraburkholderia sp.]|nr:MAG: ortholog of Bordetella pertussis (BX470248) BP2750 [uncultured Paraburkholderia sp.]CAH2797158.1 MAG: ortholog of Bordetella pertussis (BX470248) BP2750 [uncultured Paraburkholderia sp.]CAH2931472.1 MAG: ortholog of Bordetella pertussis (BX470248) BP2750 [uncultured Paraburkholderia sp.]CAH2932213.1 MAG: ortholog of Bordetella pertussis (BX470248) BP2750 [uncultured Paraburkholderia sp.]
MMFSLLHRRGAIIRLLATASALALSACASSPPCRFYTLAPSARTAEASNVSAPAALFDIQSVSVPAEVERNQLVVRLSETQVQVLENERWASPLSDEIRTALSIGAAGRLSGLNARRPKQIGDAPVYRVAVDVQRFESWPGARVIVDAIWRIRARGESGEKLTCRSIVFVSVAAGYDALAAGHRRALTTIAEQLATAVRALDASANGPALTAIRHASNTAPTVQCPSLETHVADDIAPVSEMYASHSGLVQ